LICRFEVEKRLKVTLITFARTSLFMNTAAV